MFPGNVLENRDMSIFKQLSTPRIRREIGILQNGVELQKPCSVYI